MQGFLKVTTIISFLLCSQKNKHQHNLDMFLVFYRNKNRGLQNYGLEVTVPGGWKAELLILLIDVDYSFLMIMEA